MLYNRIAWNPKIPTDGAAALFRFFESRTYAEAEDPAKEASG